MAISIHRGVSVPRAFGLLFLILFFFAIQRVLWASEQVIQANQEFGLKSVGSRIKMGLNKTQTMIDSRPYSEVQLKTGERLLWNQSGQSAYQVRGEANEVFARTSNSNSVNQNKIAIKGKIDADALARYQGQLAEAQARINITQARIDGLKLKQGAGMASADDLKNLAKLQKNMPAYKKAYQGLETRAKLSGPSIGRTMRAGLNGAITVAGIHAGISLLSDTIDHEGNVNVSRALGYMAEPSFLGGIAGGTVGAMVLSSLPVPGIGGGILKALPMFMGGAIGFEVGSGNIEQVNWVRMLSSTTASALAFGFIGGPLGIGASILAGMVVDQLFESPQPDGGYVEDPFVPDWGQIASGSVSDSSDLMTGLPEYIPTGLPFNTTNPNSTQESVETFQADATASEVAIPTLQSPSMATSVEISSLDPSRLEELNTQLRDHYDRYVKSIKNKDADAAEIAFQKYKSIRDQINLFRSTNIK